jgi:hypothetical protein
VQVELGGLIQDPALVDRGVATLERLGDLDHLTRIGAGPSRENAHDEAEEERQGDAGDEAG